LFQGAELYRAAAEKPDLVEKYGKGTPDDWMERRVYTQLRLLGVAFMLLINIVLFGVAGLAIWAVQMMWIPVWAAGVVNGIGHFWGYRNYQSADASTNIVPWGLFIGGEELHNNHHAFPSSARLSSKWWELDIGWMYIRVLVFLRLAQVRRLAPRLTVLENKQIIDMDTVQAVVFARMHVLSRYVRKVLNPVSKQAFCVDGKKCKKGYRQARRWLAGQTEELDPGVRQRLEILMKDNEALRTVYQYRQRLQDIWEKTASSQEQLLQSLRDWVSQAEGSGVQVLQDFAHSVRAYSLPAVKA
ncbi:MAG: transposase, partial [gamma proteobacterium symbiont of Bathyaustriella thionipta]|nr:transposase [gamma proteobacterium symbiont of Bathyaustriella thionipta]